MLSVRASLLYTTLRPRPITFDNPCLPRPAYTIVYVRVPLKGLQISQKYVTSPESSEVRGGVSVTFQTTLDPCKISYQVSIDGLLRAVVVVVFVFCCLFII